MVVADFLSLLAEVETDWDEVGRPTNERGLLGESTYLHTQVTCHTLSLHFEAWGI